MLYVIYEGISFHIFTKFLNSSDTSKGNMLLAVAVEDDDAFGKNETTASRFVSM